MPSDVCWTVSSCASRQPKARMICFHFAGGMASFYRHWAARLPPDVEVCAVELPGRGTRSHERLCYSMTDLLPELTQAMRPYTDLPCVLFGHSLGSLFAFELARSLRREGQPEPLMLIASAGHAPHLMRTQGMHLATDEELVDSLRNYHAIPDDVLANPDWRSLALPVLRADLWLASSYRYSEEPALSCPIHVFGATEDLTVPPNRLDAWRQHTATHFSTRIFAGDHFYLRGAAEQPFFAALSLQLEEVLRRSA